MRVLQHFSFARFRLSPRQFFGLNNREISVLKFFSKEYITPYQKNRRFKYNTFSLNAKNKKLGHDSNNMSLHYQQFASSQPFLNGLSPRAIHSKDRQELWTYNRNYGSLQIIFMRIKYPKKPQFIPRRG
jgi:hypothetical protein